MCFRLYVSCLQYVLLPKGTRDVTSTILHSIPKNIRNRVVRTGYTRIVYALQQFTCDYCCDKVHLPVFS